MEEGRIVVITSLLNGEEHLEEVRTFDEAMMRGKLILAEGLSIIDKFVVTLIPAGMVSGVRIEMHRMVEGEEEEMQAEEKEKAN